MIEYFNEDCMAGLKSLMGVDVLEKEYVDIANKRIEKAKGQRIEDELKG